MRAIFLAFVSCLVAGPGGAWSQTQPADQTQPAASHPAASQPTTDALGHGESLPHADQPAPLDAATLPEPIVFLLRQQVEAGSDEDILHLAIQQWLLAAREDKRKVGDAWLTRAQQVQLKKQYEAKLKEAVAPKPAPEPVNRPVSGSSGSALGSRAYGSNNAPSRSYGSNRGSSYGSNRSGGYAGGGGSAPLSGAAKPNPLAEKAKKEQRERQTLSDLQAAVPLWPDLLMRELLLGELELRQQRYVAAEQRFARLIEREPLIAAFHQGRGLALLGQKNELDALEEFFLCLQFRDDSPEPLRLIETAYRSVSATKSTEAVCVKARQLLGARANSSSSGAATSVLTTWLMPGGGWQSKGQNALFTPPYDRLIFRQGLAVPITEDTLLCDATAVTGSDLLYIQAPTGQIVRAEVVRSGALAAKSKPEAAAPVVAVRVRGATFWPPDLDKPAPLPPGCHVTIQSVNFYRQMGQEIRTQQATVTTGGMEPQFSSALLAGESAGAVFVRGRLVGFLSGRTGTEDEGGAKSHFYGLENLSALVDSIKKESRPALKTEARGAQDKSPQRAIVGSGFLLIAIIGERLS